ncbi:LytS/YhcK type 5TM receptor domain-containing protein [Tepidibacillus infernus]|uniref:histidine kinase n=1 Tax=Tepidibacillus decaturensis TaxID=1413211 RepID=A0A135L4M0_9BACI|nr:sensor histidine kinase [Tepidibacillus decaturensis]KXG43880.1 histidine kinase [Tepidibacillus decaturensis]
MFQLLLLMIERIGLIVTIAFVLTRSTTFRKLIDHKSDTITKIKLAILFGLFGIVGTYTGVAIQPETHGSTLWIKDIVQIDFDEALANSRVVGVAIGGLLGGPVVGLGAGLIAAVHRMLLGGFTGLACGMSTITEGLMAGMVYKKFGNRRIVSTSMAFLTGFVAETVQMLIILLLAKPFDKAWALVQVIGLPMIIANSIGIAIFIAIIHSVIHEEDRIEANQAQKVLHIADQTLVHLRKGLNEESATEIAKLLLKTTRVSAVSITDKHRILSHVGLGSDHHIPGHSLLTEATKRVLQTGKIYVAKSTDEIRCEHPKCPLQATIIVPIKKSNQPIGILKFYFSNPKQIRPVDKELALGLGRLLSHQLEVIEAEKQAKLVTDAEIKALQAQVNPHFLFNSLNTIVALIRTQPDLARKLLIQLGHFFRQNLNASMYELVTFKQELEHTQAYLNIEQARFSERLKVNFDIDKKVEHVLLPPLTLQPLVENAIKHGLKNSQQEWMIDITLKKQGNHSMISVKDNGIGMEVERINQLLYQRVESVSGTGLGLYNVHQRLLGRFGEESRLHIESEVGKGTLIWFLVPIG